MIWMARIARATFDEVSTSTDVEDGDVRTKGYIHRLVFAPLRTGLFDGPNASQRPPKLTTVNDHNIFTIFHASPFDTPNTSFSSRVHSLDPNYITA